MRRRNGFTLIELLVVIAIIGILAAIIFPVYAQAKKSAYKSSDLSNMNALRTALQLYKSDTGAYPPALLGYVGPYQSGGQNGPNITNGNIVPPNAVKDALYPRRVDSIATFRPALHRIPDNLATRPYDAAAIRAGTDNMVTTAFWPNGPLAAAGALQGRRFGDTQIVQRAVYSGTSCQAQDNFYYRISGYDAAPRRANAANSPWETHYQLFWSAYAVPETPCDQTTGQGSAMDDPRQLGYSDPPETTVITWNTFFRDYDLNGEPLRQKQDLVLFLGGSARPMDSRDVAQQGWAIRP